MKLYDSSSEMFKSFFERFNDLYFETQLDGVIHFISPSVKKLLGYSHEELIGENIGILYIDYGARKNFINEVLSKGEVNNHEIYFKHKSGHALRLWVHAVIFLNESGEKHIITIARDVTEYFEAKRKQKESEDKYKMVFEKMLNAFFILKPVLDENNEIVDMCYVEVNPGYERQTKYKASDIIGKLWSEKTQLDRIRFQEVLVTYSDIFKSGESYSYEIHNESDGEYYSVNAFRIKKDQIGVIFQNITESKKTAEKIIKFHEDMRKRVIERTNELQHVANELEYLARTVPHDLKSSLKAIDGYTGTILEDYEKVIEKDAEEKINQIKNINRELIEMFEKKIEAHIGFQKPVIEIKEIIKLLLQTNNNADEFIMNLIERTYFSHENDLIKTASIIKKSMNEIVGAISDKYPWIDKYIDISELVNFNLSDFVELNAMKSNILGRIYEVSSKIHNLLLSGNPNSLVKQVCLYTVENIDSNISLKSLSENIYINKTHLSETFRQKTGMTFVDYLTLVKIERAKKLLSENKLKVKEIAEKLGYDDVSYFCNIFKSRTGVTPTNFDKIH